MFLKRIITLVGLILLSSQVVADSSMPNPNQYFGVTISVAEIEPDNGVTDDEIANINLKAGYDFFKFLSVEVHLGGSGDVYYTGGFLRGNLPLNRINLYGLAGAAYVDDSDNKFGDSYFEPAFGIGIELYGNDTTALTAEYIQYGFDDVYSMIGVGLVHHFDWPAIR